MQLLSVNLCSAPSPFEGGHSTQLTGIRKLPQTDPVYVHLLGLEGDVVYDQKHHGGPDQAVYVYTQEDYRHWEALLGGALEPGMFGENLTVSGFSSADVNIGDQLQVGAVRLEVTDPRIPCASLAARMGDPSFVLRFREVALPGLYCRVLEPGNVQAGDPVEFFKTPEPIISLVEMFELFFLKKPPRPLLERALAAPVGVRTRRDLLEKLGKAGA